MEENEAGDMEVDVTPYRSSLGRIMSLIKELNVRDHHKEVLEKKKNPIWGLVWCYY